MKKPLLVIPVVVAMLVLAATHALAQTNVIYFEDFAGPSTELVNGKVPDISVTGAAWQAGNLFYQNGHWDTLVAGSANGQAAWLPFTPVADKLYILETEFYNPQSHWLAVGFFSLYPVNNSAYSWTDSAWYVRHSNSGYLWTLSRVNASQPDQQAFLGYGTGNPVTAINGDLIDGTQPVSVKIVLNTGWPNNSGTYTYEYWLNGTMYASGTIASSLVGSIAGVGLSYERSATSDSGADVYYFRLVMVPEPGVLALAAAALVGLAAFRKQRV